MIDTTRPSRPDFKLDLKAIPDRFLPRLQMLEQYIDGRVIAGSCGKLALELESENENDPVNYSTH